MAVSNPQDLIAAHQELLLQTRDLLTLARAESWEVLLDKMPAHQYALEKGRKLSAEMPAQPPEVSQPLREILVEIEVANRELIERLEAWRGEIADVLGEIDATRNNGRRLNRAYGA